MVCAVGRKKNTLERVERMSHRKRFFVEHVQRGAFDLSRLRCRHQCFLIDDWPSAHIDDNGAGLFSTGWGHGDALHMSDMDPDRPGMEVFEPHESPTSYGPNAADFRDARTGALIFGA